MPKLTETMVRKLAHYAAKDLDNRLPDRVDRRDFCVTLKAHAVGFCDGWQACLEWLEQEARQ